MAESNRFPHFSHPTGGRTRLILVRHGQTAGNAQGLLHGHTDLALNDTGIRQAELVAEHILANFLIESVISSPLQRAISTAGLIAGKFGLTVDLHEGLLEMNFGDLEGISVQELLASYPDLAAKAFDPSNRDLQWPNGESRAGFHLRVMEAFAAITASYDQRTVAIVSHNGVLGSFLAQVRGQSPDNWQSYRLANCSVSMVDVDADGTEVHLVNASDHLEGLVSVILAS